MKNKKKHIYSAIPLIFIVTAVISLSGLDLHQPMASAESEIYYGKTTSSVTTTEIISYNSYTEDTYHDNFFFSDYHNTNTSLINVCAPEAGADILGFYDRYCTSLISNWVSGHTVGSNYIYYSQTNSNVQYIQPCIDSLYASMGTNSIENGTSRTQYQTGLQSYVQNAGYTISFTSAMSGSIPNISTLSTQLQANKVITLYMSGYTYTAIGNLGSTQVTYTHSTYSGNHMVVVYGYRIIRYYNASNVNFRTDSFLVVTGGANKLTNHYILIDTSKTSFINADVTYIY